MSHRIPGCCLSCAEHVKFSYTEVIKCKALAGPDTSVVSSSQIERAKLRASNPMFSGSPASSRRSSPAVSQMSSLDSNTSRQHRLFAQTQPPRSTVNSASSAARQSSQATCTPSTIAPLALFDSPIASFPIDAGSSRTTSEACDSPLHSVRLGSDRDKACKQQEDQHMAPLLSSATQMAPVETADTCADAAAAAAAVLHDILNTVPQHSPASPAQPGEQLVAANMLAGQVADNERQAADLLAPQLAEQTLCTADSAADQQATPSSHAHGHVQTAHTADADADSVASLGSYLTSEQGTPYGVPPPPDALQVVSGAGSQNDFACSLQDFTFAQPAVSAQQGVWRFLPLQL